MGKHTPYSNRRAHSGHARVAAEQWEGWRGKCPTCGGYWPEHCSCPDRDDEVEQRDRFANGESAYDGEF